MATKGRGWIREKTMELLKLRLEPVSQPRASRTRGESSSQKIFARVSPRKIICRRGEKHKRNRKCARAGGCVERGRNRVGVEVGQTSKMFGLGVLDQSWGWSQYRRWRRFGDEKSPRRGEPPITKARKKGCGGGVGCERLVQIAKKLELIDGV